MAITVRKLPNGYAVFAEGRKVSPVSRKKSTAKMNAESYRIGRRMRKNKKKK